MKELRAYLHPNQSAERAAAPLRSKLNYSPLIQIYSALNFLEHRRPLDSRVATSALFAVREYKIYLKEEGANSHDPEVCL